MAELFEIMEQLNYMPANLAAFWMALVPKNDQPTEPLGIRPISILSVLYRGYATVRAAQVQPWAQAVLHPAQLAYIKGRQVQPALTKLATDMDRAVHMGERLCLLSLDTSKAFPSAIHSQVFLLLEPYGFPNRLIQTMRQLYGQGQGRLRLAGQAVHPQQLRLQRGIHQGCPLSVLAFNILLKPMCDRVAAECNAELLVFADDVTIKAATYEDLCHATQIVTQHFESLHFRLNETKTQYWCHTDLQQHKTIVINGVQVKDKEDITILGWTMAPRRTNQHHVKPFLDALKKASVATAG